MTAMPSAQRYVRLSGEEFRMRLREALDIYVAAMNYPPGTAEQRAPMWLTHALREGWRAVAALDDEERLVGIAYGYRGMPGQWWHEQVRRGVTDREGEQTANAWLGDYFELTEIHVRPGGQGRGTGEDLLRMLLDGVPDGRVLLSTPEGDSRAWKLYRRVGFGDVLRQYRFAGDPRPFAVLGRTLPLD
ncbi:MULTISPECIES: GNAT family N-acetyltransferase [Prauserella salsuginis group]|uniref:Ribosomal protein S18 acetylase RimI-like enzyme n=2 Tax=Prauserella salsuginis group TaxID=2893672 RepID=A0A839XK95_9PSEU|nr:MULTISPECIES: GNAT family N-acetyltransferase [Prauserella salsuginis group]MBB3661153.1 ribosomal protein S18 acetylase RimI-like enzyme [Prauserella sediminis]MCR3719016.1 Acetyltransferase (GNAT) family protein [Prauserella flava]MCR3733586.1 Acetyltransferase (GNAT) family protein [Prauserella salsuginis]